MIRHWIVLMVTLGVVVVAGVLMPTQATQSADPIGGPGCIQDQSIILDIKKKQEEIKIKEKQMVDREAEINARETAISEELIKLEGLRVEISKQKTINDKLNEEIMGKLVETFEKMSPKAASTMLTNMEDGLAVTAMSKISTQRLAKIMNLMDPERASQLSELLALGKSKKGKGTSLIQEDETPSKPPEEARKPASMLPRSEAPKTVELPPVTPAEKLPTGSAEQPSQEITQPQAIESSTPSDQAKLGGEGEEKL